MTLRFFMLGKETLTWSPKITNTTNSKHRSPEKAKLLLIALLLEITGSEISQSDVQHLLWSEYGSRRVRTQRMADVYRTLQSIFGSLVERKGTRGQYSYVLNITGDKYHFDVHEFKQLLEQPLRNYQKILSLYSGPLLLKGDQGEPIWHHIRLLRDKLQEQVYALLTELIRRERDTNPHPYITKYLDLLDQIARIYEDKDPEINFLACIYRDQITLNVLGDMLPDAQMSFDEAKRKLRGQIPSWLMKMETLFVHKSYNFDEWIIFLNSGRALAPFTAPHIEDIVNREALLSNTVEYLVQPNAVKIVTLVGMAGIGKTTVANKIAQTAFLEKGYFKDGVLWAYLDKPNLSTTLITWAYLLGRDLSIVPGANRLTLFRAMLESKSVLMVLDNADIWDQENLDFSDLVKTIQALLPPFTKSRLLITTRSKELGNALGVSNKVETLDVLKPDHAIELLRKSAEQSHSHNSLMMHTDETLKKIADRVGYHPLALKLLVSSLDGYTTMDDLLILIDQDTTDVLQRVHIMIKGLVGKLKVDHQNVFARLGIIYSLPLTVNRAVDLISNKVNPQNSAYVRRTLGRLAAMSLLQEDNTNNVISLHPLVARVALSEFKKLSIQTQLEILNQYSQIYMSMLESFDEGQLTLFEIMAHWGHFQNILHLLATHKLVEDQIRWVTRLNKVWFALGRYDDALSYLEQILPHTESTPNVFGWCHLQIARVYLERSELKLADTHLSEANHVFRQIEDDKGIADTLHFLGQSRLEVHHVNGDSGEAIEKTESILNESLKIRLENVPPSSQQQVTALRTEWLLAEIPFLNGNYHESVRLCQDALLRLENVSPSLERDLQFIRFCALIGVNHTRLGEFHDALYAFNVGMDKSEQLGEVTERTTLLSNRAIVLRNLEQFDAARDDATQAIELLLPLQDGEWLGRSYRIRAWINYKREDYSVALEDMEVAISYIKDLEHGTLFWRVLQLEACVFLRLLDRTDDACVYLAEISEHHLLSSALDQLTPLVHGEVTAIMKNCGITG